MRHKATIQSSVRDTAERGLRTGARDQAGRGLQASDSGVPAVSVCIPTYNYGRFLGRAIESTLSQTFGDFELIVCDNASTDNTQAVLATFSHPRLKVFTNERNIGLFENFNRCLELAQGELVKFLCADDWLAPTCLEKIVPIMLNNPEVGLLTTRGFLVDEEDRTFGLAAAAFGDRPVVPATEAIQAQANFLNLIGMPSSAMLRRDLAQTAGGFDPAFAPASDVHLWLKILCSKDLGWVPEPLCYLRIHASKEHGFAADPSDSTFRSWEDVAARPNSRVTAELLDRALFAEAERSMLYVVAHLARGHVRRALQIFRFTGEHVRWGRIIPRLVLRTPRLALNQLARIRALRSGRLLVYGRRSKIGPRLEPTRAPHSAVAAPAEQRASF